MVISPSDDFSDMVSSVSELARYSCGVFTDKEFQEGTGEKLNSD